MLSHALLGMHVHDVANYRSADHYGIAHLRLRKLRPNVSFSSVLFHRIAAIFAAAAASLNRIQCQVQSERLTRKWDGQERPASASAEAEDAELC